MKKSVLLLVSFTLVAWFFPSIALGRSIQPPPCCNWTETTSPSQALWNPDVSLIPDRIASAPEGLPAEPDILSHGIPGQHSPLGSLETLNQLYVTDPQADLRLPFLRKNPSAPDWAFS
jgi:hypothetical protein